MIQVYNDIMPLNDNFEVPNEAATTYFERVLQVKDFFKEILGYLTYFQKIYNFFKSVIFYIYWFVSIIFFAICCYFLILIIGILWRLAKEFVNYMIYYLNNKKKYTQAAVPEINSSNNQRVIAESSRGIKPIFFF